MCKFPNLQIYFEVNYFDQRNKKSVSDCTTCDKVTINAALLREKARKMELPDKKDQQNKTILQQNAQWS